MDDEYIEESLDFKDDLKINPDALDIEWLNQPVLFMRYAEQLAMAERKAKRADRRVKICQSELILKVQNDPSGTIGAGNKATAPVTEAYYRTHPDYTKLKADLFQAEYERDMMLNAVQAFNQRRVALENLVKLLGQSYFAAPKEPRNIGKEHTDYNAKRELVTAKILNTRKRKEEERKDKD